MSTLMQRDGDDPNKPLYYAPRWVRDRPLDPPPLRALTEEQPPLPLQLETQMSPQADNRPLLHENSELFEEAVRQALRDAIEPVPVPPPPPLAIRSRRPKRSGVLGVLMRWTAVLLLATVAIAAFIVFVPLPNGLMGSKDRVTLDVRNSVGSVNELLDLGVRLSAAAPGAMVTVKGLPTGARLTAGVRVGPGEWRIPSDDLERVTVIPPDNFRGQVNVSVKLLGNDGSSIDSNSVRLAWMPAGSSPSAMAAISTQTVKSSLPPPRAPASEPARPPAEPMRLTAEPMRQVAEPPRQQPDPPRQVQESVRVEPVRQNVEPVRPAAEPVRQTADRMRPASEQVRQMDPREVAALLQRAEELVANGDFLPARPLLQRAAEARSGRAAYVLATTYDPATLQRFGTQGPVPDMTLARAWYQKAKEWGHVEAEPQLETLATFGR